MTLYFIENQKILLHDRKMCSTYYVTEYSDPPENPGTRSDFTENIGPHINVLPLTLGAEACLSLGLFLTLESSDNRTISPSTFPLNITFFQFFMKRKFLFTFLQHIYHGQNSQML